MEAGISDRVWSVQDLGTLLEHAATKAASKVPHRARRTRYCCQGAYNAEEQDTSTKKEAFRHASGPSKSRPKDGRHPGIGG